MKNIVIVDGVRTPFGRLGGGLRQFHAADLGAIAIEKLVEEVGGNIVGRMAVLAEGDAAEREDIIYLEKLPLFRGDGTQLS